jgi:hypothetical protein
VSATLTPAERATVRRAIAIARLYSDAAANASIAYYAVPYNSADAPRKLDASSLAWLTHRTIITATSQWAAYESMRDRTIGAILVSLAPDDATAHLALVATDLDARIADPRGTRRRPIPLPAIAPAASEVAA